MKRIKFLGFSIILLSFFILSSCSKDEDDKPSGATAEITVKYNGTLQKGFAVNMFDSKHGPSSTFFKEFFASKTVVTNDNGIAVFKLQDVYDLDVVSDQTTLYFAIFSNQGNAYVAITIEKGETKSATINLND